MTARLKSGIFVSALIRRVNASGGFAAVLRHGSEDAGAIFVTVLEQGGSTLYAQAPQAVFAERKEASIGGRVFEKIGEDLSAEDLDARFQREARMDPDFWVVEVELFGNRIADFIDIA